MKLALAQGVVLRMGTYLALISKTFRLWMKRTMVTAMKTRNPTLTTSRNQAMPARSKPQAEMSNA